MPYVCEICKRVFESKQGMRAHCKVHKGEFARVTVTVPKRLAEAFKAICHKHGITTCHSFCGFVEALIEADKHSYDLERLFQSPQPLLIQMNYTFLGKPRSAWKVPVPPSRYVWPPSCSDADDFHRFAKEVACLRRRDWVRLEECWGCFQRGGRHL